MKASSHFSSKSKSGRYSQSISPLVHNQILFHSLSEKNYISFLIINNQVLLFSSYYILILFDLCKIIVHEAWPIIRSLILFIANRQSHNTNHCKTLSPVSRMSSLRVQVPLILPYGVMVYPEDTYFFSASCAVYTPFRSAQRHCPEDNVFAPCRRFVLSQDVFSCERKKYRQGHPFRIPVCIVLFL